MLKWGINEIAQSHRIHKYVDYLMGENNFQFK